MRTAVSSPPRVRLNGGSTASRRLRSSHAASCREAHTTASMRAIAATIGAICRRSGRCDQYDAIRLRRCAARPM